MTSPFFAILPIAMAKPKTHYWKKENPRNPVPLKNGGYLELEIISQSDGIVQVTDPEIQETLIGMLGTYGLEQIDKSTYEDLKKNRSSTYLKPQVREEIGGVSQAQDPVFNPQTIEVGATVQSDNLVTPNQTPPLPEDYKPKASKRPKPK